MKGVHSGVSEDAESMCPGPLCQKLALKPDDKVWEISYF